MKKGRKCSKRAPKHFLIDFLINIDGKKSSIEVLDKIVTAKINKQLISDVLYKTNANYKGRKAKTKQKNETTKPKTNKQNHKYMLSIFRFMLS